ncbi:MAG: methyltransferase domain-containing protein [Bdellovibrionales bacterium]
MIRPRLVIDEHGRLLSNEQRISDINFIQEFYDHLNLDSQFKLLSQVKNQEYIVEAFDAPLVILDLKFSNKQVFGINTDGIEFELNLESCFFDEWDRMNGLSQKSVPWILSRSAQEKIFQQFDEFDDDSFKLGGTLYPVIPEFSAESPVEKADFWSNCYIEGRTGWDLQAPHPALIDMHPRLKLPKSRVLVLGCGAGHDAAYLAREGHLVTAVDFSSEALQRAQNLYGTLGIEFLQLDVFNLPAKFTKNFDFVLEHTLYCAVSPSRRKELVQVWNRCLVPGGYFMGIFFTMEKRVGPPYGAREWEIRERLKKSYHILFWGRLGNSPGWRDGVELFTMGQKKDF